MCSLNVHALMRPCTKLLHNNIYHKKNNMILTAFMKALATASVVAEDASTCKTTHSAIKHLHLIMWLLVGDSVIKIFEGVQHCMWTVLYICISTYIAT